MKKQSRQQPPALTSNRTNGFCSSSTVSVESGNRYRLSCFIGSGFQIYEGRDCHNYRVELKPGITEDQVYDFLTNDLGIRSIPPLTLMEGSENRRILEIFESARDKGLLDLVKKDTVPSVNPPPGYGKIE